MPEIQSRNTFDSPTAGGDGLDPARADSHIPGDGHATEQAHFEPTDAAQQSLADALRVSFTILKLIMIALLVIYVFTGIFSVDARHRAVRLRFGEIVGQPGQQVYGEGWHFGLPYPIEQIILVPTDPRVIHVTKTYWPNIPPNQAGQTLDQVRGGPLNPQKSGSLITGDANIVHARFQTTYHISDPAAYIRHVGDLGLADRIVRDVAEQSIVHAAAQAKADDVIRGRINRNGAAAHMQRTLDRMGTGIRVDNFSMPQQMMPLPVRKAYQDVINAENERGRLIEGARQQQTSILNATAGEAYQPLFDLVHGYELAVAANNAKKAADLSQQIGHAFDTLQVQTDQGPRPIGGKAAGVINQAQTDRTEIVEQVKSEYNTFKSLLPEYQRNPKVVKARLWQNARQSIFTSPGIETIYAPTRQITPYLNRNPEIERNREKQRLKQEQQQAKQASQQQNQ